MVLCFFLPYFVLVPVHLYQHWPLHEGAGGKRFVLSFLAVLDRFNFVMKPHLWESTELNMMLLGSCGWKSSFELYSLSWYNTCRLSGLILVLSLSQDKNWIVELGVIALNCHLSGAPS